MSYLLHVSVLLAGLYLFYWLLLRRETFFQLNRWLLVGSLLLALGIPLLKVPPQWSIRTPPPAVALETTKVESKPAMEASTATAPANDLPSDIIQPSPTREAQNSLLMGLRLPEWSLIIYLLGVGVFAMAFLLQLSVVLRKRRGLSVIKDGRFTIYELEDDTPPFSFGNWIFLNPTKYEYDTYSQILEHEKLHVAQVHTLDKILAELVVILLWFNPFSWLMRTAITKNLEYLTDAEMLDAGTDAKSYQLSLVKVAVPQHALSLSTNYNESFLKSRVTMMNAKKSSAGSSWKYFLLLPVLLLSVISLNATQTSVNDLASVSDELAEHSGTNVKGIPAGAEDKGDDTIDLEEDNAPWKNTHREIITREFPAASLSSLDVHNITGEISVEGYAGKTIKVEVEKVINAMNDRDLAEGVKEVQLGVQKEGRGLYLYHDAPYTSFTPGTKHFQVSDCNGGNCYEYQFFLHYKVLVPYDMELQLSTINGGDILVEKVQSAFIAARHISGSVYMKEVAGVQEVYTISGHIEVDFTENPRTATSFVSTSGHVILDLLDGFGGEVSFSSISGSLHSDFPVNGKQMADGLDQSMSPVRIGSGGERMEIRSISGNLILK